MKLLFRLCILLSLVGCTEVAIDENMNLATSEDYYAVIEGGNTRTYVDEQIRMRWTAEDKITLFEKNTYNRTFMFTGKTGANAGGFTKVSTDDDYIFGYDVDANYAVYPHSSDIMLDETDLFFTLNMPAEQTYAENSFGLGANTMVAVSDNNQLIFKNVGSYLRVRLYGDNTSVSSVTLTTKGDEAIAGEAKVTPIKDGEPTCVMTGSGKSIRLTCPTPVAISSDADAPTDFWIVVPPVTLANGFTVTVENCDGNTQTFDVDQSFTFERNKYNNMVREFNIEQISHYSNGVAFVAKAGDLSSIIPEDEKFTIESLKISGELNGTDIRFIREMAGLDYDNYPTDGSLKSLDIGKSTIVEGGESYTHSGYGEEFTENYVIGRNMFYGCSLEEIILPENTNQLMSGACEGCPITSITIPKNVTIIDGFEDCKKLSEVFCLGDIEAITSNAFRNCVSITSFHLTSTVQSIGTHAFSGTSIQTMNIPEGVKSINSAFQDCKSLSYITLPSTLRDISYAFKNCTNLVSINLPSNVSLISGAFEGCTNLSEVSIPNSVRDLGYHTFYNCRQLKNVILPEKLTKMGDMAFGYSGIISLSIPNSVEEFGFGVFTSCYLLETITLPDNITSIPTHMFEESAIKSIVIPANVETIEGSAFHSCSSLNNITCLATIPPTVGFQALFFNDIWNDERVLYVPKGCKANYENAEGWSEIKNIVELEE